MKTQSNIGEVSQAPKGPVTMKVTETDPRHVRIKQTVRELVEIRGPGGRAQVAKAMWESDYSKRPGYELVSESSPEGGESEGELFDDEAEEETEDEG